MTAAPQAEEEDASDIPGPDNTGVAPGEDLAECVLCERWSPSLNMDYDDDTGFHTCPPSCAAAAQEQDTSQCSVCGATEVTHPTEDECVGESDGARDCAHACGFSFLTITSKVVVLYKGALGF